MATQPPRPLRGFTIIEMMIVVIIIGILAAVGMPMLMEDTATKLISAADVLSADIAFAQIESVTHGDDPRVMVFDTAAERYFITTASAVTDAVSGGGDALDADPINNPVGNVPYETTYGQRRAIALKGVEIDSVSLDGDNQLQFGLYGELDQTTDAVITLTAGGSSIDVTIDAVSGEASIGQVY